MAYNDILEFLKYNVNRTPKLGLAAITELMNRLDNPQDKIDIIHVAGTNGKGSTSLMLSTIMLSSGYNVGLFTSPHLVKYNERFKINNIDISDTLLYSSMLEVFEVSKKMTEETGLMPTEFEFLTAVGFYLFYKEKVDIAVIEVGLGGRFDATNVIKKPLASVITSIGIDHVAELTNDIKSIAFEKCGIIKAESNVAIADNAENVLEVIKNIANERKCLIFNEHYDILVKKQNLEYTMLDVPKFNLYDVKFSLLGDYQIINLNTVLNAVSILRKKYNISLENLKAALENSKWPARMEYFKTTPPIIVDGSHNVDGAKRFKEDIEKYFKAYKKIFLFSMLKDKDYRSVASILNEVADIVVLTEIDYYRAADVNELACCFSDIPVHIIENSVDALDFCKKISDDKSIICITGSLYLIGQIYKYL